MSLRPAIDWQVARDRLAKAKGALADALDPPPARVQAILMERARLLAEPHRSSRAASCDLDLLCFRIGKARYGIEPRYLHSVGRLGELTLLPHVADHVRGLTAVRGEIVIVIDLARFHAQEVPGLIDLNHLVVLGVEAAEFGILVDEVDDLEKIASDGARLPADGMAPLAHVRGVTDTGLSVLDGAGLLAEPAFYVGHED